MKTLLDYEKSLWEKGIDLIAGVDEVGRGSLAGPMVSGAVMLRTEDLQRVYELLTNNDVGDIKKETNEEMQYNQIKDSKLLSPKKREKLSDFIIKHCLCYTVFEISAYEIDLFGISACTQKAFTGVIKSLKHKPEHILTDAFPIKVYPRTVQSNITSGDRLSITIAAASIIAKVYRDNLMCSLAKLPKYKCYGFEKHKGYGTKYHIDTIIKHGTSDIHRKTFIHF